MMKVTGFTNREVGLLYEILTHKFNMDKFDPVTRGCEVQHSKNGIGELIISCGDSACECVGDSAPCRHYRACELIMEELG
jgi:hypothetical protein